MAKEWILNSVMNRFQLNFKRNVGATSESIRNCAPKNLVAWEEYYYKNVRTKEHIEELGRKLYTKISEVIQLEVEQITEDDCIKYMKELVIDRTYDGYVTEIRTVYGQLEKMIAVKIESAPDDWDRLFNVDFFIKVNEKYIGLQIKPVGTGMQLPEIFKEQGIQRKSHIQFAKKFGGKVFYIYSQKINGNKIIKNIEVVDEIKSEIYRIQNEKDT